MHVLVVNTGSSSVKLRVLDADEQTVAARDADVPAGTHPRGVIEAALTGLGPIDAVGHRVVHGGAAHRGPVRIDDAVIPALEALVPLAPLHQRRALEAIDATARAFPDAPAVACFDTAFHATLPAAAATYAVPEAWRREHGVRRYGFHGLSHAHVARRAAELTGRDDLRLVSCHLGAGASLAAIAAGRSVDTTMGFTPLEGIVMATRAGSVDPGMLLWLLRRGVLDAGTAEHALDHESGLRGLAGTPDMREVLGRDDADARLALDVYVHRLRAGIAAMAAAMDGVDAIAFTGGVGEHAPAVRERAAAGLGFLGVRLDRAANATARPDAEIGTAGAPVRAFTITAREDLEVARQVRSVLAAG